MLVEEGIRQAIAFIDLLQDPSTGLFRHFYLERTGRAYVDSWSRGQGWALLGLLDCLEVIGETIDCSRIRASVSDLITALISSQRPNGHWGSLTQDSLSSDESSAAAFFVSGLLRALRLGIVDESVLPVVRRAWSAVVDSTDPNGVLRGVSAAVYSSTRESHYRNVPLDQLVPWGQGPWLVAREEIGRYNNAHEGSEGSISVGEGLLMEGNTRD
jgi:unsaturated rhamnogalacturonyl hydrolase